MDSTAALTITPAARRHGPGPCPARPPRATARATARATRAAWALLAGALALHAAAHAAEPDTASTRTSDNGAFVVSVRDRPEPIPLNALHAWTVHVETADGTPVETAEIAIDGGMPMHDHGLPTAPRVTAVLGDGDYLLEGMKFQMPGHWQVRLRIESAEATDSVTFELML